MSSENDPNPKLKKEMGISRREAEEAKRRVEIAAIQRQGKIDAWHDYAQFAARMLIGLGCLTVGGLEYLEPNLLPIVLTKPELVATVGWMLFAGKRISSLVVKIDRILGEKQ